MAAEFDLGGHVRNSMSAIIAAISIALAFGIGSYILYKLNEGTKGNLTKAVDMLESQSDLIGTVVTFLMVGVLAGIGIGLVVYLYNRFSGIGGK